MEPNQNQPVDFSDYTPKPGAENDSGATPPPDLDRSGKKRKIQMIIIVTGFILTAIFWGYYFYQQNAKNQMNTYYTPEEMIPK